MVSSHCMPSGVHAANELPLPGLHDPLITRIEPVGAVRGIFTYLHGMGNPGLPYPIEDSTTGLFPSYLETWAGLLNDDGWIFVAPPYVSDTYNGAINAGLWNDIDTDAGNGSRYLANVFRWWFHYKWYLRHKYHPSMPLILFGGSWGGMQTFKIIEQHQIDVVGWGVHVPATVISEIPGFTPNFQALDSSGLDVSPNAMDNVLKPGMIGWGRNDPLVGYLNAQEIANNAIAAGRPVTVNDTNGHHHFPETDAITYANWVASEVSISCPAIF